MIRRLLTAVFLTLLTVSCTDESGKSEHEAFAEELKTHDARSYDTWEEFIKADISQRIVPTPETLVDYIRKDNIVNGWSEVPRAAKPDKAFYNDIIAAVNEVPEQVKAQFNKFCIGIFLIEELGGTAYAEILNDFDKHKMGFIVLDVNSLNRKANEWASWKAQSAFKEKTHSQIILELETEVDDNRKQAIQYILLHEIAHLLGPSIKAHADYWTDNEPEKYDFTNISWLKGEESPISRFDKTFTQRGDVRYYKFENSKLGSDQAPGIYSMLQLTDFPSLYGATSMYEDFAESYAMYVHVALMDKPWSLSIRKEGNTVLNIHNPILEERCLVKKQYFDKLFSKN